MTFGLMKGWWEVRPRANFWPGVDANSGIGVSTGSD